MNVAFTRGAELGLASILLIAGLAKQRVNAQRATDLALADLARRLSDAISPRSVSRVWRTIGWLEVVIGAALVIPASSHAAALAASGLLVLGLGYLILARQMAPGKACGCFGTGGRITGRTIARCAYVLGWALVLVVEPAARKASTHTAALAVAAVGALLVAPIVATSLGWRDVAGAIRRRWNGLQCFARARTASEKVALEEVRDSEAWREMAEETGAGLRELTTTDTWMEGNWRIWEMTDTNALSDIHIVAGRYLGTDSRITRLMVFDGPVDAANYVGTWDSRLAGFELPDQCGGRVDKLAVARS